MTDGSRSTTIAPPPKDAAKEDKPIYKVAEKREDGTVILELEDGRMIPATLKEGVEVRKGTVVEITSEGEDASGAPTNASVVRSK